MPRCPIDLAASLAGKSGRRGIIRGSALCTLCRYRHKGHWSGHKTRLNRDLSGRFGSEAYAAEELVAELNAAFLCAHLGIAGELRHAEYLGHWLTLLKEDSRAIFTASSKASQAANFLRAFSGELQEND
jgi:antirestriction protein ArdC